MIERASDDRRAPPFEAAGPLRLLPREARGRSRELSGVWHGPPPGMHERAPTVRHAWVHFPTARRARRGPALAPLVAIAGPPVDRAPGNPWRFGWMDSLRLSDTIPGNTHLERGVLES